MAWQKATGCGRRSLGETAVGRYKRLVGPKLRARGSPGQRAEAALALQVLNRMIRAAKPVPSASLDAHRMGRCILPYLHAPTPRRRGSAACESEAAWAGEGSTGRYRIRQHEIGQDMDLRQRKARSASRNLPV